MGAGHPTGHSEAKRDPYGKGEFEQLASCPEEESRDLESPAMSSCTFLIGSLLWWVWPRET